MSMASEGYFYQHLSVKTQQKLLSMKDGFIVGAIDGQLMRLGATCEPIFTFAQDRNVREDHTVIPNLLTHPGAAICVCVGDHVLKETLSHLRDEQGRNVYVFDPYNVTGEHNCSINILDQIDLDPHINESNRDSMVYNHILTLANCFLQEEKMARQNTPPHRLAHIQIQENSSHHDVVAAEYLLAATFLHVFREVDENKAPPENLSLDHCHKLLLSQGSDEWKSFISELVDSEGPNKLFLRFTGNMFTDKSTICAAPTIAAEAISPIATEHNQPNAPSLDLTCLEDPKTTIYIVMPHEEEIRKNKKWLRAFIQVAIKACPTASSCVDFHDRIKQKDRKLFIIDHIADLGRINTLEFGLSDAFAKGITLLGGAPDPATLIETYGKSNGYYHGDLPSVQVLDQYDGKGHLLHIARESHVGEIVKNMIKASRQPVTPAGISASTKPRSSDLG